MRKHAFVYTDEVYHQLAVFYFSTLSLILIFLVPKLFPHAALSNYFSQGFFILTFIGYTYLFGSFVGYYLRKTFDAFKKNYPKYKLWYWLVVGVFALIALVMLGFAVLESQNFWNIVISTGLLGALTFIGWVLKKLYEKYWKRE